MAYAWIIMRDYLVEAGEVGDAGMTGPRGASDEQIALAEKEGHVFRLYDDDGELYYRGRLWTDGDMTDEQHCFAPLDDFGMGWAGCTSVKWQGHPEWDCG